MLDIKHRFPIFTYHPKLVYLDSAATSQKPDSVIDAISNFYTKHNANVHRGLYPLSETATDMYERSRTTLASFINADPKEVIFVANATDGMNLVAHIVSQFRKSHINLLSSDLEHHSSFLPWQELSQTINFLNLDSDYRLDFDQIPDFDVASLVWASNVTGAVISPQDIKKLRAKSPDSIIVLDASQVVGHIPIDVSTLDVDFIVFSGHKMYGPTGIGVVWGRKELLDQANPYKRGGGMIRKVTRDSATWAPVPERFEAGTPAIAQAVGLAAAVEFIQEIGIEEIHSHEQELASYLYQQLTNISGIQIFHPKRIQDNSGVFSFSIDGVHPHDIAQILGDRQICVRAGHHCVQILHTEVLDIPATTRVSLGIYNSRDDIDKLMQSLSEVVKMFT